MGKTKNRPRYSVGTWDTDLQGFTPQKGAGRSINITLWQLKRVLKRLRCMGYTAHRSGNPNEERCSDLYVLVERTDGMTREEIIESWKR